MPSRAPVRACPISHWAPSPMPWMVEPPAGGFAPRVRFTAVTRSSRSEDHLGARSGRRGGPVGGEADELAVVGALEVLLGVLGRLVTADAPRSSRSRPESG
ncbi:hypothetical protein GCM10020254_77690 [Streptomyces goshikiensis]